MNRYARMLMAAGTLTTIALVWNAGAADPEPRKAPNFFELRQKDTAILRCCPARNGRCMTLTGPGLR